MDKRLFTHPLPLKSVRITDGFWGNYQRKVLNEVIPYQWEALNDRVPGADRSGCIRNFEIAAGRAAGEHVGWVFQDSYLAKWLEAVAYALVLRPDPDLERRMDETIELICEAQQPDGYLDTYYIITGLDKRFTNLQDHHELYCFGHMTEAAVAYYYATGKDALLQAMIRYADCIDRCIGPEPGKLRGYPGHEEAELALIRLYGITHDEKHLRLAKYFIDERGQSPLYFEEEGRRNGNRFYWRDTHYRYHYYQAGMPVRAQRNADGHAVRAMYLLCGVADVARVTGDESLLDTAEVLWKSVTRRQMYITGAIGSSHVGEAFTFDYDLPNDTVYGETCAAIGLVFFARRMLELRPRAEYADVMERALYNGVISGMSLDGKRFFYVNPLEVVPEACEKDEGKRHVKPERQKWFGCACCPPNIARLLGSVSQYMLTAREGAIYVHLYIGAELDASLNGQPLSLRLSSGFPWQGRAELTVVSGSASGRIALRVPGWCRNYTLRVNGRPADAPTEDGYLLLDRDWQPGDAVTLDFDMLVTRMAADPRVREDAGKVAVTRGPVVYCLEEKDNGGALHLLRLPRDAAFEIHDEPELLDGVTVLTARGLRRSAAWAAEGLYAPAEACEEAAQTLTFIPYYAWANRGVGEMCVWVREA